MNVLGEKQKGIFNQELSNEERTAYEREFNKLYFSIREKDEKSLLGRLSHQTRKKLYPFVLQVYKIINFIGGFSSEVIGDHSSKTDRPVIYAVSHVGKYDIQALCAALQKHCYILTGDYEHLQGKIDWKFLMLNGVVCFNERVKEDRKAAGDNMVALLREGIDLMYFPEGAWNMTPHLPMLPCYWGIIDVARKSKAIIVPIAACQYGKKFKFNIGNNFDVNDFSEEASGKTMAITSLRDEMASLCYEIYESEPTLNRSELTGNEWEQYIQARLKEWTFPDVAYIDGLVYKPKDIITPQDAFSHLSKIAPTMQNAFLFNKRLK